MPERASLNNQNGDALRQYFITPIRNAAAGKIDDHQLRHRRGILPSGSLAPKLLRITMQQQMRGLLPQKALALNWKGTDAQGVPLEEGTAFDVTVILAQNITWTMKQGK